MSHRARRRPCAGHSREVGNLLTADALQMKGQHQIAALLVKTAGRGNPENPGVVLLNLLEEFLGQDILGVGVAFFFSRLNPPLSSSTAGARPGCRVTP